MASGEELVFNAAHPPSEKALAAFGVVQDAIRNAIVQSRQHWDAHEPRMWARAAGLSSAELGKFDLAQDLVAIRAAPTSYGTVILGKLRLPAVHDEQGEGFVHVRIHDPPNRGVEDVMFHSLFTDEGHRDADGRPTTWQAIQTEDMPLEFFNE